MNVISLIMTCLLCLMIELNLIMKSSSISSKKCLSNFNTAFLKTTLFVTQFENQKCNADASKVTRIRSVSERIDDFD